MEFPAAGRYPERPAAHHRLGFFNATARRAYGVCSGGPAAEVPMLRPRRPPRCTLPVQVRRLREKGCPGNRGGECILKCSKPTAVNNAFGRPVLQPVLERLQRTYDKKFPPSLGAEAFNIESTPSRFGMRPVTRSRTIRTRRCRHPSSSSEMPSPKSQRLRHRPVARRTGGPSR